MNEVKLTRGKEKKSRFLSVSRGLEEWNIITGQHATRAYTHI